ncbi:MAG: FHA domain-containing protein [Clostridia bacterium]|nr:FHA domain-containing protein [Clostridia bacterium]
MEVRVTKCQNGHYYDANKHDVCPHCGDGEFSVKNITKESVEKHSWFKKTKTTTPIKETAPSKVSLEPVSITPVVIEDVVTQGNYDYASQSADDATEGIFESVQEEKVLGTADLCEASLFEQVQQATGENDAKTMGFFSVGKTIFSNESKVFVDPVVGWLTCVRGRVVGKSYPLKAGKNSIGRLESNDIALLDEESISREKHAWLIYEPRKRKFYIQPGEGSGLTYINDENVFVATEISNGDAIDFGDIKFIFTPLCGEQFTWDDYLGER